MLLLDDVGQLVDRGGVEGESAAHLRARREQREDVAEAKSAGIRPGWYVWGVGAIVTAIGLWRMKPANTRLELASTGASSSG
jgi:hypothetical protein